MSPLNWNLTLLLVLVEIPAICYTKGVYLTWRSAKEIKRKEEIINVGLMTKQMIANTRMKGENSSSKQR